MKVVINKCYGGFSISNAAIKRLAELQGRNCYFFTSKINSQDFTWVPIDENSKELFSNAFDIPNPNEVLLGSKNWRDMSTEEREAHNKRYEDHVLNDRPDNRTDPLLIQVIEELGDAANGSYAKLAIVEIPDGTNYEIEEYDGMEHISEVHGTWGYF